MKVGDLVKPKGHQNLNYRELIDSVKSGVIIKKVEINYGGPWTTTNYTVLWDNCRVVVHAWMEIEKIPP